jgi:hypothetical protein
VVAGHLRVLRAAKACADAGTSPHQECPGMAFCRSTSPRVSRPASRDPTGCRPEFPRTAPDWRIPGSLQRFQVSKSQFENLVRRPPFVHRSQTGGYLRHNFEGQLYFKPARAFDEIFEGFPLYKLHRVEVTIPSSAQVQHRGNVCMPRGLRAESAAAPIHHRDIAR